MHHAASPARRPGPPSRISPLRLLRPRYRVLTLRTVTLLALLIVPLLILSVYFFGHRSFWIETERSLLLISAALFLFLAYGLYHGYRLRKTDRPAFTPGTVEIGKFGDSGSWSNVNVTSLDLPLDSGGVDGEGCLSALVSLIVGIVLVFVLAGLLFLLVNGAILLIAAAAFALSWVFYRALRQTFARSRQCRGNLPAALRWAAAYTVLYSGWLYAVAFAARHLLSRKLGMS